MNGTHNSTDPTNAHSGDLHFLDYMVIAIYFLLIFCIALYTALVVPLWNWYKQNKEKKKKQMERLFSMELSDTTDSNVEVMSNDATPNITASISQQFDTIEEEKQTRVDESKQEEALQPEISNLETMLETPSSTIPLNHHTEVEEEEKVDHARQYFLANGNMNFFAIGCALFSSNIGSEHFVGISSSAIKVGIAVLWGEWLSVFFVLLLGWLFAPFYLQSRIYTLPEFLQRRYNKYCRFYLSFVSLILYVLTKISVALYAGAIVFRVLLGWDIYLSAGVLTILTGIYTVSGGLTTVIYTEVLQTVVLVIGGLATSIVALIRVGGWQGLKNQLDDQLFHLFQPIDHTDFPWTGVLFGMIWSSLWYWSNDQNIVQRVLSAKDLNHARGGTILAGFCKILPFFIMVIPGLCAKALYGSSLTNPNEAYIRLAKNELPPLLKGLMISAIIAALMSSLASIFHSSSTLFTMDLYKSLRQYITKKIKKQEEEEEVQVSTRELEWVGRISGMIIVVLGIIWIGFIPLLSTQLYIYTHKIMSYFAPNIAVVFLFGVLFKYVNGIGAIFTLLSGFVIGMSRLILEIIFKESVETNWFIELYVRSNFLHFSAAFALYSIIALFVVSLISCRPISKEQEEQYTIMLFFKRKTTSEPIHSPKTYFQLLSPYIPLSMNILFSCVLIATMITLFVVFR